MAVLNKNENRRNKKRAFMALLHKKTLRMIVRVLMYRK